MAVVQYGDETRVTYGYDALGRKTLRTESIREPPGAAVEKSPQGQGRGLERAPGITDAGRGNGAVADGQPGRGNAKNQGKGNEGAGNGQAQGNDKGHEKLLLRTFTTRYAYDGLSSAS